MPAPLHIVAEDAEGRRVTCTLHGAELRVGRAPGSELLLDDRNVSRLHCRLVRYAGTVVVEDMGSANGTYVNGQRLAGRHPLREGDVVSVGDWDISVEGPGLLTADPETVTASMPIPRRSTVPGVAVVEEAPRRGGTLWRRLVLLVAVAAAAAIAGYAAGMLLRREPPPSAPVAPLTPR